MSKCWYCNNELTTGDNPKHFGICNKCYDEMFKSDDTIIRSFTNKISDLEAKLKESESKRKSLEEKVKFLTEEIEECFVDGQKYNELREQKDKEIQQLKKQLAEKENSVVLKPDKYVIVTNGWKKQGYGIARVHQEVRDVYYYCSNNRIGSFSPMTQYGEFKTIEEAQAKLKEVKRKGGRC